MTATDIQPASHPPLPPWRHWLAVLALALGARAVLFASRYRMYLEMNALGGTGLNAFGGSDVLGYLAMARHLAADLDFSYWLMGARPPLFPLTVAAVYRLGGGDLIALALQAAFGALTALAGYLLAYRLFTRATALTHPARCALIAGVVMALDPASVSASVTLMAEPLFNLFFTACILFLALFVQTRRGLHLGLAALAMAGAMFSRPTAIYFWLAAPLIMVPFFKRWWRPALALAAVGLTVYLGWSVRNLRHLGLFTYSTQTNFTLLFLRGLSAEHLATGAPVDELYEGYVRELYLRVGNEEAAAAAEPWQFWNFHVPESPEVYAAMGALARQKLLQYWPHALLGTGLALWRMFSLTDALPAWFSPVELAYHVLLYGGALFGAWQAYRQKAWQVLLVSGIPILYVTGLTLASQVSAMDTRMRSPISAPIIVLGTYGLALATERWQERRWASRATRPTSSRRSWRRSPRR